MSEVQPTPEQITARRIGDEAFSMDAQSTLLDRSSTGTEILSTLNDIYNEDGSLSQARITTVQHLMQQRQQIMTALSNMMSSLHNMAMSVVRNLRLG